MSPWSNQSWKDFSSNKHRPAQLVSAVTQVLDGSPTWIYTPSLGVLKLWEQPSEGWMYGVHLSRSGPVVERSTGLMTDSPTMSPVCLHNSCFGENIIKGPLTSPPTSHPPPRSWEADIGWAASLGFHMSTGQNSFPEVMDVSGLVSSCHLSSYRLGYFHNDVDLRLKVSQSSGSAYQFKTAHFSLISLSDCAWSEKCADGLLFAWVVSNCTHNGKHVEGLSRNNMQHVWDTSDDPDVPKLVHQNES